MSFQKYLKMAPFIAQELGAEDTTDMEYKILCWFANRKESNSDWWATWEEHTRSGRVYAALRMYVDLAMASKVPKAPDTSKILESAPEPAPVVSEPELNTFSGGVFDL